MTAGVNHLLDAIDALTQPTTVKYILTGPDGNAVVNEGGIWCQTDIHNESLLERLRSAVAGNTGAHAGGASDPRTRIPIDPNALGLYSRIEDTIIEWLVSLVNKPPGLLPEGNLREWYRAYRLAVERNPSSQTLEALESEVTRKVWSWVQQVTNMFDPPRRLEVTRRVQVPVVSQRTGERLYWPDGTLRVRLSTRPAHCPQCDQASAFDPSTGDHITALVIEYRSSQEDDAVNAAVATCRSCEWRWVGDAGIRELRLAIDAWEEQHAVQFG